jgi:hypothetical protein
VRQVVLLSNAGAFPRHVRPSLGSPTTSGLKPSRPSTPSPNPGAEPSPLHAYSPTRSRNPSGLPSTDYLPRAASRYRDTGTPRTPEPSPPWQQPLSLSWPRTLIRESSDLRHTPASDTDRQIIRQVKSQSDWALPSATTCE